MSEWGFAQPAQAGNAAAGSTGSGRPGDLAEVMTSMTDLAELTIGFALERQQPGWLIPTVMASQEIPKTEFRKCW